jgi:SAM-dependent methyltransferase
MFLYAVTILLSSFLLFQVQPIIAKLILPWFGGSSSVWATCMLFFQAALLLGYWYAHWVSENLTPKKQLVVHILLLGASFLTLPIIPNSAWKPGGTENPSLLILGLLAATIGLPYVSLSTTSPLLQAWYSRSHAGAVPYRLFALSNLASMLALLTYPFLIEPNLSTRNQALIWSAGYVVFAGACVWTALLSKQRVEELSSGSVEPDAAPPAPGTGLRLLWLGLAACASGLLIVSSSHITQDVAAIPFLWILPLAVYLLSFILCFETTNFYWRWLYLPAAVAVMFYMGYGLWPESEDWSLKYSLLVYAGGLFLCSMACHGEVSRLKPHPRHLTIFYVMISLGGAAGGVFAGLIAPNLFKGYFEFPILLVATLMLLMTAVWLQFREFFGTLPGRVVSVVAFFMLGAALAGAWTIIRDMVTDYQVVVRNFYGQLRVYDEEDEELPARKLYHGVINHGQQMKSESYRRTPVTYYCEQSGIGKLMKARGEEGPMRIGVLGLGCGTMAAFGRAGDYVRFYEINPLVVGLASNWFTYLKDSKAQISYQLGDGRLSLENEPGQGFDVLAMDAFSGDSVPVHLLTREAMKTYFRHLRPGGVLAVNISNRYLALEPVMERAAADFGKMALSYSSQDEDDEDPLCFGSTWVLMLDAGTYARLRPKMPGGEKIERRADFRPWTDDYSNLLSVLKK